MTPSMMALLFVLLLLCVLPAVAQGQDRPFNKSGTKGGTGGAPTQGPALPAIDADVDDVNATAPTDIRSNYLKRFPFANDAANDDGRGQSREASAGTPQLKLISPLKRLCLEDNKLLGGEATEQFGYSCIHFQQDAAGGVGQLPSQTAAAGAFSQNGQITTFGYPMSDTMFQIIDRENRQRLLELMFDPQRRTWQETTKGHMQAASAANSTAAGAETSFNTSFKVVTETLINVANERSAVPTSGAITGGGGNESFGQAVYIVQQMYKHVFLPMALLLLMPGAVMTQVKGMISGAFLGGGEDSASPFTGIMRALIAIFLIPATQLIVSYCIDVGNALAWEVRDPAKRFIDEQVLKEWASEQTFNPPLGNVKNAMKLGGDVASQQQQGQQQGAPGGQPGQGGQPGAGPGAPGQGGGPQGPGITIGGGVGPGGVSGGVGISGGQSGPFDSSTPLGQLGNIVFGTLFPGFNNPQDFPQSIEGFLPGEGKAAGQEENEVTKEDQKWLSSVMQVGFNSAAMFMGDALTILGAYQIVFMCYLFLMGPIAASFYAWPSGIGSLFKNVFNKWVDAVVVLALWRFWWCVILAVMTQRILYLKPDKGDPAEMMVYNCFMVLLLYVPFQPFSFHPGPIIAKVLEKASSGGAGGGGGGGGAPTGGGQAAPGASTPSQAPGTPSGQPGGAQTPGGQQQQGAPAGGNQGTEGGSGADGQGQPGGSESGSPGGSGPPPSEGAPPTSGGSAPPPPPAPPPPVSSPPAASPPPGGTSGSQAPPNAAPPPAAPVQGVANSLRSEFGGSNVQPAPPSSPPTVALAPQGAPRIIVNTGNAAQGRAGYQAMRSRAPSPSYLQGAQGVAPQGGPPPGAGTGAGAGPGAGGGAPAGAPAGGGATNIHTHVHVTATGGGSAPPSGGQGSPSGGPGSPSGGQSPPGQGPPPGSSPPAPPPDVPPPPPSNS